MQLRDRCALRKWSKSGGGKKENRLRLTTMSSFFGTTTIAFIVCGVLKEEQNNVNFN